MFVHPHLQRGAGRVVGGREVHHLLHLLRRPVRVLPEDDATPRRGGRQCHEGVAGAGRRAGGHAGGGGGSPGPGGGGGGSGAGLSGGRRKARPPTRKARRRQAAG